MCGITGFVTLTSQKPSRSVLDRMTKVITHRGPDDEGGEIIDTCALGNKRLAVIDLSPRGHMPMWDKNKTVCITYNGEIYNYQYLKTLLAEKGYRFQSDSDTEVILYLYKEFGEACVTKLRGMFAFAIWNVRKQELFIARDHFGIKPLYYHHDHKVFIFGSEIKSILAHPQVKKTLNPEALSHYFSLGFGCIASPLTIFEGIYKLPPAHYAVLKNGQLHVQRYWDVAKIKQQSVPLKEAVTTTKRLLEKSVQDQLVSDVPLGSFLSGGIDSSLISAFAQKHTNQKLKTFSIGFEDKKFDESQYAQQVAAFLKTDHHHKQFTATELLDTLPKVVSRLDEPLADASILPTYLLSEFTRQHVTVALSGDGGDELFAGYPTYLAHRFAQPFRWLPRPTLKLLNHLSKQSQPIIEKLPLLNHLPNLSTQTKLERFFEGVHPSLAAQYLNFMGPLNLELKHKLLKDHHESALSCIKTSLDKVSTWSQQNKLQYLDFTYFLSEDCLVKTDRASSYNSLEVRVPFLDVELVEFVFSLPSNYKVHNLTLKYLLKQVATDLLPQNIIDRPKKGFGIPTHIWLSNQLKPLLVSKLNRNYLLKQNIFSVDFVEMILNEHFTGKKDHRMVLWNLLLFQLWYEEWFSKP